MTIRSQRAAEQRAILRARLGGKCSLCPATDNLQFHLKCGDGAEHHAMNSVSRVYFYVREAALGNIEILCGDCHRTVTAAQNRARRNQRFCQSMAGVSSVAAAAARI